MNTLPSKDNAPKLAGSEAQSKTSFQDDILYPDPASVKGRTLGALLRGESLTHLDVWRRFGSARAAHHIHMLRKAGWPVEMDEETVKTSDAGRPATIGIYFISAEIIEQAGERGQRYARECARIEAERRAA